MDNLISIAIYTAIIIVGIVVIGVIFSSLYKRASKELAFVRTGLGGQLVVKDGGAMILPVLHGTIDVNMNTMKLEVRRTNESGLITKDRLRVDVTAEFYVRVQPLPESIANAAQTLGSKTMNPMELKELVEGKFVDALRAVAAEMEMEELHEKRAAFVQGVQTAVSEDLLKNGLELESVSLTGLDQTNREFLNPDNVFDAEGLTKMTKAIEDRKKIRNDIEQETQVQIAEKNLDAKTRQYNIHRDQEYARLNNEREIAVRQDAQNTEIETARSQRLFETEQARAVGRRQTQQAEIEANQAIELSRASSRQATQEAEIVADQAIELTKAESRRRTQEADIVANQAIELARQESAIAVAKKSEDTSKADALANEARTLAVKSEEQITTARQTEVAERTKKVQLIEAEQEAQTKSIGIVIQAQAERDAAQNRAAAVLTQAQAEADAEKVRAAGAAETYKVEAEGKRSLNEAANLLSADQIALAQRLALIDALPSIIEQSVKPMQNIDGIKILHVDGINGSSNGAVASASNGGGNFADAAASAALRYRSQAPLVDALMAELGLSGGSLDGLVAEVAPKSNVPMSAPLANGATKTHSAAPKPAAK